MSTTREPDAPTATIPTDSPAAPETPVEPVVPSQDTQRLEAVHIELRTARAQLAERDQAITALREQLARAVASYRAAAPDLPADMVRGDTIDEVEASLHVAREVVAQVRRQVQAQAHGERVPGGAPARSATSITHLTPAQKIAQGLAR